MPVDVPLMKQRSPLLRPPQGVSGSARFWALSCVLWLGLGTAASPGGAAETEHRDGPVFSISLFDVRYSDRHLEHPGLNELLPFRLELGLLPTGYVAARPGIALKTVEIGVDDIFALPYHASAIGAVSRAIVERIRDEGLAGVYVAPDESQIRVDTAEDLRPEGETYLMLIIKTARIRAMRTVAIGDRIDTEWHIDNSVHDRIRSRSPLQPTGAVAGGDTDLVLEDVLNDYLFRLNRHPGRRVDAALSPAGDGIGVELDYLVAEAKPWYAYAQTSNTGTSSTQVWQQRFGFVHNQLRDSDDTLRLEVSNAGSASTGINFSYDAPWFSAKRPWWWGSPEDGPEWLAWLDRRKLPWFGHDDIRFRVWGAFTSYSAEGVEDLADVDGHDWNLGGRLTLNVFQRDAFFIDLFGGAEMRGVVVDNKAGSQEASQFFLLPQVGVQSERINEVSSFFGSVLFEGNFRSIQVKEAKFGGDPTKGLEALGRSNPDDKWALLRFDFGWTHFLEPLVDPHGWEDPATEWNSTLAHELSIGVRGQYAFNYRLIPQAEQVLGGLYSVRGYEQSTAVGDNTVIGSIEYRFHLPHSLPVRRRPLSLPGLGSFRVAPQQVYGRPDWDLILRAFVDAGVTHRNKRPAQIPYCPGPEMCDPRPERLEQGDFLVGAGIGAELHIRNNFRARVDWARALRDSNSVNSPVEAGDHEIHLFFSILY